MNLRKKLREKLMDLEEELVCKHLLARFKKNRVKSSFYKGAFYSIALVHYHSLTRAQIRFFFCSMKISFQYYFSFLGFLLSLNSQEVVK